MDDLKETECKTCFAPLLIIKEGIAAIEFYKEAFGAVEVVRYTNPDGTIHVAEMMIEGAMFHIREDSAEKGHFDPKTIGGVTAEIELLVANPDALLDRAVEAGGEKISPMTDYFYGLRQGILKDPFGHCWIIEKRIKV